MLSKTVDLISWTTSHDETCENIRKNKSTLKIILKTKNDPYLINGWIEHHKKIVGNDNIIIFDNCSSNPEVLKTYEKYRKEIIIVKFDGFHNDLHDTRKYPELYCALRDSCTFFTFLDTDERLILIDEEKYYTDKKIVEFLEKNRSLDIIPGTWLNNIKASEKIFFLGNSLNDLENGLTWGKPLVNTKTQIEGFINHNIHTAQHISAHTPKNIFILHLTKLNPKQRIQANINKLIARGFATPSDSIESIIKRRPSKVSDKNILFYINEIIHLTQISNSEEPSEKISKGMIKLAEKNSLEFHSEQERETLHKYTQKDQSMIIPNKDHGDHGTIEIIKKEKTISHHSTGNISAINYRGYIDGINSFTIHGWATDQEGNPCFLSININGQDEIKINTTRKRNDLLKLNLSNGLGGFNISLETLTTTGTNKISVRFPNGEIVPNGILELKKP